MPAKDLTKPHFVSLIIPVYKQEKTIVRDIKRIKGVLDTIRYPHEIIVVIDGILDKSLTRVKQARIPQVRIVSYRHNQGKAYAIRTGMKYTKGDYVMFMDAGMEIDPNGISMLLEHMEWYDADIVVGSKRHPASRIVYSPMRKVLSYGYYWFVRIMFGVRVRDTQAGIKIFRKNVLAAILPYLLEREFAGDLEFLVAADAFGFRNIYEAPIKLDYQLSKFTSAATYGAIWNILIDTCAIYYRKNFKHHYAKKK